MKVSAFSGESKEGTPFGDSIDCLWWPGEQSSKNGGGIARAWIEDPKVYPGTPMFRWWRYVPEGRAMATDSRFVKIVWCLLKMLATLCWLQVWKIWTQWQGLLSFPQRKNLRKSKKSSHTYINMKIQTYCNYTILIWMHPGRQNVHWTSVRFLSLSCSMLLRFDVSTCDFAQIDINEGKFKTTHFWTEISEYNHK